MYQIKLIDLADDRGLLPSLERDVRCNLARCPGKAHRKSRGPTCIKADWSSNVQ